MNTRSVQLSPGHRRQRKAKTPSQSILLVLLPMILSVIGGAVGYFAFRSYFSRATEIGVFVGYMLGWAIEASVRVPTETAAQRRADELQQLAATHESDELRNSDPLPEEPRSAYPQRRSTALPGPLAAR
jgi:hypothetical protein